MRPASSAFMISLLGADCSRSCTCAVNLSLAEEAAHQVSLQDQTQDLGHDLSALQSELVAMREKYTAATRDRDDLAEQLRVIAPHIVRFSGCAWTLGFFELTSHLPKYDSQCVHDRSQKMSTG